MKIISLLKYIKTTLVHKWYVFQAGMVTGCSIWQLITHDLSKFGPSELPYYADFFHGEKEDTLNFSRAWLHHQNVNPHHWEYWIPRTYHDKNLVKNLDPIKIPPKYVKEMAADWLGATRAYEGSWPKSFAEWKWVHTNPHNRRMHPESEFLLKMILVKAIEELNKK